MLYSDVDLSPQDEDHLAAVLDLGTETVEGLGRLRQNGSLLDLTVKVGESQFKAHKVYLAAVSGHFRRLLVDDPSPGPVTVELEGLSPEDVETVLDFLYTQQLELSLQNVTNVLHVATHLLIETLLVRCSNFLVRTLSKDNILQILDISKVFSLSEVHQEALAFVSEAWSQSLVTDFMQKKAEKDGFWQHGAVAPNNMKDTLIKLTKEDLIALLDGPFCCESEVQLFNIAKSWAEASANNMACVGEVMSLIQFPLMSEKELGEIEESNAFLKTDPCASLIKEARDYHKMPASAKVLVTSKRTKVRGISRNVVFSTGYSTSVGANDFASPYVLDISTTLCYRWISLPNIPEPLGVASVIVINNFLIACGVGNFLEEGVEVSSDCAIFDPRSYSWSPMESMEQARVDFPLVSLGETMYAIGGSRKWRSVEPMAEVEVFRFKDDKWGSIKEMPEKLTNHAACESGGKIYVCGGIKDDKSVSSNTWLYDPTTDEWTDLPKMLEPEQGHNLLPLTANQLFMFGAESGKIQIFVTDTNQWTHLQDNANLQSTVDAAVWEYSPHLSVISWPKQTPALRDEQEAAAGDSKQVRVTEHVQEPVQFVTGGSFKSPWVSRRIWEFPEGVNWRHCTNMTIPWKVLSTGKVVRTGGGETMMLDLLRNLSLAESHSEVD